MSRKFFFILGYLRGIYEAGNKELLPLNRIFWESKRDYHTSSPPSPPRRAAIRLRSSEPKKTGTPVPFAAAGGLLGPQALVPPGQMRHFCKIVEGTPDILARALSHLKSHRKRANHPSPSCDVPGGYNFLCEAFPRKPGPDRAEKRHACGATAEHSPLEPVTITVSKQPQSAAVRKRGGFEPKRREPFFGVRAPGTANGGQSNRLSHARGFRRDGRRRRGSERRLPREARRCAARGTKRGAAWDGFALEVTVNLSCGRGLEVALILWGGWGFADRRLRAFLHG